MRSFCKVKYVLYSRSFTTIIDSTLASHPSWLRDSLQERHEYPMWDTDKWDAENWRECFLQLGCDPTAIARFLVLNQCTNKGPYVANNVLAGLLKKEQDAFNPLAKPVRNSSAYLTATWNKMIRLLEQKENPGAGSRPNGTPRR